MSNAIDFPHPKSLSYSAMKTYGECPLRYKWNYVDKKKPKIPENAYYSICGTVKQKMFENFYNDKLYLKKDQCAPYMESQVEKLFDECLLKNPVLWEAPIAKKSKEDLIAECKDGVKKGIKIIKDHKLLTEDTRSEAKFVAKLDKWIEVLGYIDFVIRFKDGRGWIIDGKDTADPKKMKDVDPRQLWIYSYMYEQYYGKFPEKVGFMFWRHDTILYYDPKEGVEQVKEWIKKTYWDVKNQKFDPKPSSSNCFFCKYKYECDAYNALSGGAVPFGGVTETSL